MVFGHHLRMEQLAGEARERELAAGGAVGADWRNVRWDVPLSPERLVAWASSSIFNKSGPWERPAGFVGSAEAV